MTMEARGNNRGVLFLFNLSMNRSNSVLAANWDLVSELKEHFSKVVVYTRQNSREESTENLTVFEIPGGGILGRILGAIHLVKASLAIVRLKETKFVFIHMNDKFATIVVPLLTIFKVRTVLWYSHAHASLGLRLINRMITQIVTSGPEAYPLSHKNVKPLGQLVRGSNFLVKLDELALDREFMSIVSVGRISPIKYLEELLEGVSNSVTSAKVDLIGSYESNRSQEYAKELKRISNKFGIDLAFKGEIERGHLKEHLLKYSMIFSGTKKALDKSAVEGAMAGCFVVSTNADLLKLTGMCDIHEKYSGTKVPPLEVQLSSLKVLSGREVCKALRRQISEKTYNTCSLEQRVKDLVEIIKFAN